MASDDTTVSDILDTLQTDTSTTGDDGATNTTISDDDQIASLQATIATLREQLARSQADYTNLVRRHREESSQLSDFVENKLLNKFLPTLDNLERALEHTPEAFKTDTWTEGLFAIIRTLQKVFLDIGTTPMECVGQEVNPDLHEVISQIPHATEKIQAVVEKGYTRHNKTLRHAKVIVGNGTV